MFSLIEIGARSTLFLLRQTFYVGRYLIYGRQKTKEDILEEKIDALQSEIRSLQQCSNTLNATTQQKTEEIVVDSSPNHDMNTRGPGELRQHFESNCEQNSSGANSTIIFRRSSI